MTIRDHQRDPHPTRDGLLIAGLSVLAAGYGEPRVASLIVGALGGVCAAVIIHRGNR